MSDKLKTLITLLGFALLVLVVVRSGDDRFALQKQAEAHFEQGDAYLEIEVEPTWYVVVGKHTLPSGQTIVAGYSEKHGPQSMRFPALADSSLAWLRPGATSSSDRRSPTSSSSRTWTTTCAARCPSWSTSTALATRRPCPSRTGALEPELRASAQQNGHRVPDLVAVSH